MVRTVPSLWLPDGADAPITGGNDRRHFQNANTEQGARFITQPTQNVATPRNITETNINSAMDVDALTHTSRDSNDEHIKFHCRCTHHFETSPIAVTHSFPGGSSVFGQQAPPFYSEGCVRHQFAANGTSTYASYIVRPNSRCTHPLCYRRFIAGSIFNEFIERTSLMAISINYRLDTDQFYIICILNDYI